MEQTHSMGETMARNMEGAAFPTPRRRDGSAVPCVCRVLKLNGVRQVIPCGLHKYLHIRYK